MKFLILITFLFISPDKSTHYEESLLASSNDYYFTYTKVRTHPSNYYSYSDSIFIKKYKNSGHLEESHLLKVVRYKDKNADQNWTKTLAFINESFKVENYLYQNDSDPVYPSSNYELTKLKINKSGIAYKNKLNQIDMLNNLERFKNFNPDDMKIIREYSSKNHSYFVLQINSFCCMDEDAYQVIIPIKQLN